jgi:hypothetical protein
MSAKMLRRVTRNESQETTGAQVAPGLPDASTTSLQLRSQQVWADNSPRMAQLSGLAATQRKIVIGDATFNRHQLAQHEDWDITEAATHLKPLLDKWQKAPGNFPQTPVASVEGLRTQLVAEWLNQKSELLKQQVPALKEVLSGKQFNALACMYNLLSGFSALPLEQAYKDAVASKRVDLGSLRRVFESANIPEQEARYDLFVAAANWPAKLPGVIGVVAELQVASSIRPDELQPKTTITMAQNLRTGVHNQNGWETQDADVSFLSVSGQQVLVEVAATISRVRDKMGAAGAAQRDRYEKVVEEKPGRVLAYAVPGCLWTQFFVGEADEIVAARAAALGIGWGLIISGHYCSPAELQAMSAKLTAAEPKVAGFWNALAASGLDYLEVQALTSDALQKRLQRHVR